MKTMFTVKITRQYRGRKRSDIKFEYCDYKDALNRYLYEASENASHIALAIGQGKVYRCTISLWDGENDTPDKVLKMNSTSI